MNCKSTASTHQLETEQRARLKSTTLSSEEGRHSASPLLGKKRSDQKGAENKTERDGERAGGAAPGSHFIPLTLPHPLPASGPSRASSQHWQRIQRVLTRNWQPERQVTLIHRKWQCQLWYKYLILYCTASDLIKGIKQLIRLKLD